MERFKIASFGIIFLFCFFIIGVTPLEAAVFYLTNGDQVTGQVTEVKRSALLIDTELMGKISVSRQAIERSEPTLAILEEEVKPPKPQLWSGKVGGGFNRARGNTQTTELSGSFAVKRKVEKKNEFDIKGDAYYGASSRRMNAQRYYGMMRYAFSFGKSKRWYEFNKVEADHDRFANIRARVTPSVGIGYWFWDDPDWKLMTELGAGVTMTDYREDTKDTKELVLIPRAYAEKRIIGESRLSQEAVFYPSMSDFGEYRLHLDTAFKNPITDQIDIKVSWINDYNSNPGSGFKKHDMRLVSTLEYHF